MRILICRPQKDATILYNLLNQKKIQAVTIPVIKILDISIKESFQNYDCLIFTSKYAVESLFKQYPYQLFADKKIYSIGLSTAKSLKEFGFEPIYPKKHGSNELLKLILARDISKDKFAIVSGVDGNNLLSQELSKHTLCKKIEIYQREFEDIEVINNNYQKYFNDKSPDLIVTTSIDVFKSLNRIFAKTALPSDAIVTITSLKMLKFVNESGFENTLELDKLDNNYICKRIFDFIEAKNVTRNTHTRPTRA
jgi:uroporphyrinogen-III synthase